MTFAYPEGYSFFVLSVSFIPVLIQCFLIVEKLFNIVYFRPSRSRLFLWLIEIRWSVITGRWLIIMNLWVKVQVEQVTFIGLLLCWSVSWVINRGTVSKNVKTIVIWYWSFAMTPIHISRPINICIFLVLVFICKQQILRISFFLFAISKVVPCIILGLLNIIFFLIKGSSGRKSLGLLFFVLIIMLILGSLVILWLIVFEMAEFFLLLLLTFTLLQIATSLFRFLLKESP